MTAPLNKDVSYSFDITVVTALWILPIGLYPSTLDQAQTAAKVFHIEVILGHQRPCQYLDFFSDDLQKF